MVDVDKEEDEDNVGTEMSGDFTLSLSLSLLVALNVADEASDEETNEDETSEEAEEDSTLERHAGVEIAVLACLVAEFCWISCFFWFGITEEDNNDEVSYLIFCVKSSSARTLLDRSDSGLLSESFFDWLFDLPRRDRLSFS